MKTEKKFGKAFCVEAVRQILDRRRRLGLVLQPDEAGKLCDIINFSGRSSSIGDLHAANLLESFRGEYTPVVPREAPSRPRSFTTDPLC